jgi:hypothetical protein
MVFSIVFDGAGTLVLVTGQERKERRKLEK